MRHVRGITLLEVMVTVAIIGFMASMAVLSMQGSVDRQRENEATRELWASALRARQRAISTNQPVRIVVENIDQQDGTTRTIARWEQLTCGNTWDNASCPTMGCENATCRTRPDCCSELGQDINVPRTMNATAIHGLCFMPGSGRPVLPNDLSCMRESLDDAVALDAVAPGNVRLTYINGRVPSLIMVEPRTGLASVLDCDSQAAIDRPVAECAN
ncbi:prepilin-type N-terminal cleavage/methylation domain-containing protein [Comamonas sp. JC664]|uniref:pilus assembly FimT family protein n=1 Tax=Comamonas sp. JC664 TaxID=2801917 RepID=UPI00174A412C|nr:prepilin-type N-terminal cleavage/methylation domain-containing protein [Comamonas sp. JC664]MBL0695099.1 prepilin-type N-terminal cleavage/methylation domain-containing protein [Comamonas sp. JC664]GHG86174.1 hypothetical protein GCM10012319_42900 [Comamonas sp. KCTC 72670]